MSIVCIMVAGTLFMGSTTVGEEAPAKVVQVGSYGDLEVMLGDDYFFGRPGYKDQMILVFKNGDQDSTSLVLGKEDRDKTAFEILEECKAQVEGK